MIQLTNISLHFGARQIFDGLTITLKPGEKVGLIGRNGSGKSTLLKVISGQLKPQAGQVDMPTAYRVGYLAQTVELDDEMTPRQVCQTAFADVLDIERQLEDVQKQLEKATDAEEQLRLSGKLSALYERLGHVGASQMDEEVEKVLKGMGFDEAEMDQPIARLSGGWKMRVELARLLLMRPELLLLDEPTNHLDIESILWFESYLQTYEGIVIIVSHDQHVLDTVTGRTLEIS
ncbi:MAG: ATP-binding cassette domain-containing protein, partial [Saprospiraceae bacterium]|nr:ATP-binding cassette domain-containing protein [Saprospiraceae bacterium]